MNSEQIKTEYTQRYDKGILNHGVRAWFYLKSGLNLINEFKYLVAGIFGVYYTLKLDDYRFMLALFAIAIPLLTLVGFFYTHRMAKALDWTGFMFSSYFGRYTIDLGEKTAEHTEKNTRLLEEILLQLKK